MELQPDRKIQEIKEFVICSHWAWHSTGPWCFWSRWIGSTLTGLWTDCRVDILPSIKIEDSVIIRMEMKAALTEDFNFIKSKLQAVRVEVVNSTTALRA